MCNRLSALLVLAVCLLTQAEGQLLFTSGTNSDQDLFERANGVTVAVTTGRDSHDLPGMSRDGRFVTFSVPDPPAGNGLNPSADLVVYDRSAQSTRTIVNHFTTLNARSLALSSQVSPNGQFVAYGVQIGPAFNAAGGDPQNSLVIADFATGVNLSEPTLGRQISSDLPYASEFRGISFFPGSTSFVTPLRAFVGYDNFGLPMALPMIVRYDRNAATGQWEIGAQLSQPQFFATGDGLGQTVFFHTFPAISPNGTELAYFSVEVPDNRGGTQPWIARVALSNADGSNARLLTQFNPGFVPTGITWTADGAALLVSVSQQTSIGTGYIAQPIRANSAIFNVDAATGATTFISELGSALFPMLPSEVAPTTDLSQIQLVLQRTPGGSFQLSAQGLPGDEQFHVERSEGSLNNFQFLLQVTGAQLAAEVTLPDSPADLVLVRMALP